MKSGKLTSTPPISPTLVGLCPALKPLVEETQVAPTVDKHTRKEHKADLGLIPAHAVPVEAAAAVASTTPEIVLPDVKTAPPDPSFWGSAGSEQHLAAILENAATVSTPSNPLGQVKDNALIGPLASKFDEATRAEITQYQKDQTKAENGTELTRLIHRKQLFGGQAQIHWNPAINQRLKMYDLDSQQTLVRISDASSKPDPNGPSMFGMAVELHGADGKPYDVLLTGGSPKAEASQARDAQAQLDLLSQAAGPNPMGLAKIVVNEGLIDGPRMIMDVMGMQTNLDSVGNLTSWSRSAFEVKGHDGKKSYLIKMRMVPLNPQPVTQTPGNTTTEKLYNEFQGRTQKGETRWTLEFQFMRPKGDDPYDPRQHWGGEWVPAAQIVVPQRTDKKVAALAAEKAENTKFSIWKNIPFGDRRAAIYPFGEVNRARDAAYGTSQVNRGCPYLAMMADQAKASGADPNVAIAQAKQAAASDPGFNAQHPEWNTTPASST